MEDRELAACPWCGRTDFLDLYWPSQDDTSNFMAVRCHRCGISGPKGYSFVFVGAQAAAIDAWNRRECPAARKAADP